MRLILIRHGESEHALHPMIAGKEHCRGLTKQGFNQAHRLAERLRTTGEVSDCQVLHASPVLRARQTAEVLTAQLALGPVQQDDDLCELHPGEADGLCWEAYRSTYGAFHLLAFPHRPFAPFGESWLDFTSRVRTTLERLAKQFAGQTVVAVTHAGWIVASLLVLFDIPRPGTRATLDPAFASITEWRKSQATWTLVRFNDAVMTY